MAIPYILLVFFWFALGNFSTSTAENVAVNDVTYSLFGSQTGFKGFVAAFGDVNKDNKVDIFIVSDQQNITVLLGSSNESINVSTGMHVSAIFPGDYNGDGFMDILVASDKGKEVNLQLIWGTESGRFTVNNKFEIKSIVRGQPLVVDANADMIPDLFVSLHNNTREFWLGNKEKPSSNWKFHRHDFSMLAESCYNNTRIPHSHAFVDITGEGSADLFVTSLDKNENTIFETWQGTRAGLKLVGLVNQPSEDKAILIGQSLFVDINGDTEQDHILPVCEIIDGRCSNSRIMLYFKNEWVQIFQAGEGWNFIHPDTNFKRQPVTLVAGDFNQDIYIDLLCIMQQNHGSQNSAPMAVILYGGNCKNDYCMEIHRQFHHGFVVPASDGAFSAAFYDFKSDGTLDLLISTEKDSVLSIRAYENTVAEDVSFLIGKVLPGMEGHFTSNIYGCTISYKTTNTMGGPQHSSAVQLSQSAYLSLQLPHVSFGLGRLPNFVDSLTVSVPTSLLPASPNSTDSSLYDSLTQSWSMLIPNSQLFIKPYPINDPSSWSNRLLVTPSQNVITTAIVLVSLCGGVVIAIIIMHCMERQEDKREKTQEAHRFHFDAM
ncbi:T-cell immunomodulatory protein-like [Clavelina lepadiformis]|uniref:T-cell immunomodulatory protein-like n=1 Tax=Clavelina lepadiformis TaxID=159417 RepID=UPI004041DD18